MKDSNSPLLLAQPPVELEPHYSVKEIAQAWGLSEDKVRRHFENVPGVIRLGHEETKSKKRYVTLRIPARVLRAEHARLTNREQLSMLRAA